MNLMNLMNQLKERQKRTLQIVWNRMTPNKRLNLNTKIHKFCGESRWCIYFQNFPRQVQDFKKIKSYRENREIIPKIHPQLVLTCINPWNPHEIHMKSMNWWQTRRMFFFETSCIAGRYGADLRDVTGESPALKLIHLGISYHIPSSYLT